jgi:hypothetical protein
MIGAKLLTLIGRVTFEGEPIVQSSGSVPLDETTARQYSGQLLGTQYVRRGNSV